MATIFAQMNSDAIGAALFGFQRGFEHRGLRCEARLTQRCNMININTELLRRKKESHGDVSSSMNELRP